MFICITSFINLYSEFNITFQNLVYNFIFSQQGGIFFFQLIDHYAVCNSTMYIAFFEVIAVGWFYGAGRLSMNIERMTGEKTSGYFKHCWVYGAPTLIFVSRYMIANDSVFKKIKMFYKKSLTLLLWETCCIYRQQTINAVIELAYIFLLILRK